MPDQETVEYGNWALVEPNNVKAAYDVLQEQLEASLSQARRDTGRALRVIRFEPWQPWSLDSPRHPEFTDAVPVGVKAIVADG
ncbi:MAG: hypothetical protein GEU71_03605 [Actinobacteria bacterium]|nr:hypothetical protein [Actinomycetota bacterium]